MARLLIGVSGGIAAYKAVEFARLAVKAGHAVRVIQTPAAERFVGRATFAGITGAPVLSDEFALDPARGAYPGDPVPERAPISHLALVERADLYVIAPASANTLAKLAHGLADNLVSTAALAAACPVVVAPAMNDRMYRHPATAENVETLRARGVTVIPPGEGELASHGEQGVGRLAEPAQLLDACEALLGAATERSGPWPRLRVLVTAGGTREPIDSVRFIGNRSSGRMGVALAERAAARGAEVTLVAANLAVPPPRGVRVARGRHGRRARRGHTRGVRGLRRAADGRGGRRLPPGGPGREQTQEGRRDPAADRARADRGRALGAVCSAGAPGRCWSGSPPSTARTRSPTAAASSSAKRLDAIVVNDISRPRHRLRLGRQRGRDRDGRRRAAGAEVQQASSGRRGPRRGGATARGREEGERWRRRSALR